MIMKRWLAVGSAVALAAALSSAAGTVSSATPPSPRPDQLGTDFWVTFPRNDNGSNVTNSVIITGPRATTGTVSYPGGSSNFTVTPGLSTTVTLPASVQLDAATALTPQSKGVHVTALDEVSVVVMDHNDTTADDYLAIPTDAAGTEHMALAWHVGPSGTVSQFAVVATADDTEVTYTPTVATSSGIPAGTLTGVKLNAGDVLPVSADAGDLSGTPVSSSKPVGVVGGHSCAGIPTAQTQYCDVVMEEMPPTSTWGTSFYTVPLKTRSEDTFRVMASEDNTSVRLNGQVIATLQHGQVHTRGLTAAAQIVADKPVLVAQFSNGSGHDLVTNSDPFMALVTPTDQFLEEYIFPTRQAPDTHYANLVVPKSAVGQVTLDGSAITASAFTDIQTTPYASAQITLQPGAYSLVSPVPVGVTVYGFAHLRSYGTIGGAGFAPFNAVDTLELGPASQRARVGTQVCLDGRALDGPGGGLGGIPVEVGIRGTQSITDRVFSEMSGAYSYCYTGTQVGVDTVSALFRDVQSTEVSVEWFQPDPSTSPGPTPEPTPSVSPAKLPIAPTKVAAKRVALKPNGTRVLVKRTTTNAYGTLTFKTGCKPTARQPGAKHMCKVRVSSKGKVRVVSAGYGKLRVRVTATATPKPGQEQAWLPSTWSRVWKVRG